MRVERAMAEQGNKVLTKEQKEFVEARDAIMERRAAEEAAREKGDVEMADAEMIE